ncbi:MAG: UbiX family flavin prenyltransferase [Rhodospirillales bacterium]
MTEPILVAITGASGAIYGIETLRLLKAIGHPAHLILSEVGRRTIEIETDVSIDTVKALADIVHANKDQAACVSSGSYRTRGMLIAPCSIKTLSGIANSYAENLIIRAADVTLKERRRLVLMVRETPYHAGHIELMRRATEAGAIIFPPMPAFYAKPKSIEELVRQSVGRALDLFGIEHDEIKRWMGPEDTT